MVFVDTGDIEVADAEKIKLLAARVEWHVTGAVSIGASSAMIGSMRASGTITLGAGASSGALQSTGGGAITVGAGASAPGRLSSDLGSTTPVPGTYTTTNAIGLTGILYLDAKDYNDISLVTTYTTDPEAQPVQPLWKFEIGGAFTAAATSKIVFLRVGSGKNDAIGAGTDLYRALAALVVWDVTGAIILGANSVAVGNMMKSDGAISSGASTSSGPLLSTSGGAVTMGAGTYVDTAQPTMSVNPSSNPSLAPSASVNPSAKC
jgi:hypothetical protein